MFEFHLEGQLKLLTEHIFGVFVGGGGGADQNRRIKPSSGAVGGNVRNKSDEIITRSYFARLRVSWIYS